MNIVMTKFEERDILVNADCKTLYTFLSDFRNFEDLMPDQVKNWKAGPDTCSFTIEGLADLSMRIDGKFPHNSIRIVSDGKNPVNYRLEYFFSKAGEDKCRISIVFDVDLNPFMKAVASRPLQNFVGLLGEKLQKKYEADGLQ